MGRVFALLVSAVVLVAIALRGQANEVSDLKNALALQRTMQKVIREVEPAIACILVSRSEAYQRNGFRPAVGGPGKLGAFNPAAIEPGPGMSKNDLANLRKRLDLADPGHIPEAFGSGVVIDAAQGLLLTNYHVVRDASKIYVRLPGHKGSYADIHAADPRSDLAVLKVITPLTGLKIIHFGDGGSCERGQFVLSIANPFAAGFRDGQPSASWGIISNLRRRAPGNPVEKERTKTLHHYGTLLQTDARLNLGCSGGALVNLQGEMIGLTTALAAIHGGETPGGFAVPINAGLRRIIEVLRRGEEVDYGFLGVGINDGPGAGVSLSFITSGSPAEREAHLRDGDIILKVDGEPVRDTDDLFLALGTHLAGERVKLEVKRARGPVSVVEATLAKFYMPGKKIATSLGNRPFFRGLRVDYSSLLVQQPPGMFSIPPGVLVSEVRPGTPAARAQFKGGEVIARVNGRAVLTPADFYREVAGIAGPVELTLSTFTTNNLPPKVILNP